MVEQAKHSNKTLSNKASKQSKKEKVMLEKQADLIDKLSLAQIEKTKEAKELNEKLIERRVKKKLD